MPIINAWGKLIQAPDDMSHEEIQSIILANEKDLNPDYKPPSGGIREFAENNFLGFSTKEKPSIADQAEATADEGANTAAPQVKGAPVRQSFYNKALLDPNVGIPETERFRKPDREGILARTRYAADEDIKGQVQQRELEGLRTDDPAKEQPSGISGLVGNIATGAKQTGRMAAATINAFTNDNKDVERIAKESGESSLENTPIEQKALLGDLRKIDREQGAIGQIGDTLSVAAKNKMGTGQMVAEQLPNSAVSLAGGFAGFKAGGAAGAVLGPVGATIGGALGFVGGMFLGNVLLEAGGKAIEKASDEDGFTPQDRDSALREGASKAAFITGVDTATFKLGGMLARKIGANAINAGARAEAKTLIDAGVDVTSLSAINAALKSSPQLFKAAKVAGERAALGALSTGRKAAILGTGAALETVGEFAGEAGGEYAATGKADYVDATIEALSSATMSIAETAYNYNKVASGNDLSPEGIQKAVNSINDAETKESIDKIKKATNVDDAINAANESVSRNPVNKDDVLRVADPTLADIERLTGLKPSESILEAERQQSILAQAQQEDKTTKRDTEIVLPDNRTLNAQWDIVDADNVKASLKNGESQPRDRTRVASDLQIQSIAKNPDYRRLSDSPVMDIGAPVLSNDGQIVGGNGRFEALSRAYDQSTAQEYLDNLRQDAIRKGIDPSVIDQMKKPVLVRRVSQPFDTRELAIASNSGTSAQYSDLEQAKIDSERLKGLEDIVTTDTGDIALTQDNIKLVRDALGKYSPAEVAPFVDANGQLSQQGMKRIRNAMLAKAYGDNKVIQSLIESNDSDIRNILGALTRVVGDAVKTQSTAPKESNVTPSILEAINIYSQLKQKNQPVSNYLQQQDAFSDKVSPAVENILMFLDKNARSQPKITEFFRDAYAKLGSIDTKTADIFGEQVKPKPEDLFAKPTIESQLEKHLKKNGYEFDVKPVTEREFNELDNTKKAQKELAEKQAKIFGKKVVFVKTKGKFGINGVMVPAIKDTIFIDLNTPKPFHAVMAHELSHWMEQENPAAYKDMLGALKDIIVNEDGYRKKYEITDQTEGLIPREIAGDLMGDNFTKPEFWQKVAEYNPSKFKHIADSIIKWLKNIVLKAKSRGMGSEEWVTDAKKAQDIIAKAVSQYTKDQDATGEKVEFKKKSEGELKLSKDKQELEDYRMDHQSPGREGNAPLSDLTGDGNIYPDDVYSDKAVQYYGTGDDVMDRQSFNKAKLYRGKPNAMVDIYRAVPKGVADKINTGDWVTINKNYAKEHGESYFDGKYDILTKKVKAGDIFTNGDSIHEWGYEPEGNVKLSKRGGNDNQMFSESNRLNNIDHESATWKSILRENPALIKSKGNVIIYRATIGNSIRNNDYVALNESIAEDHLESLKDRGEDGRIITKEVNINDLLMANDATEFIYSPKFSKQEKDLTIQKPSILNNLSQKEFERLIQELDNPYLRSDDFSRGELKKVIKSLESKGIKYIDFYHVTDQDYSQFIGSKSINATKSSLSGRDGFVKRDAAVYGFLDPEDITKGYRGVLGANKDTPNIIRALIPINDLYDLEWDSNFNVTFGTYSGVSFYGDIPIKWISEFYNEVDLRTLKAKSLENIKFSKQGKLPDTINIDGIERPTTNSEGNNDIRFSSQKPFNPNEDIEETKAQKAQRIGQDKFNRFRVVKEFLAKEKGINISEAADVYGAETRYYGKVANQQEDFRNKVRNPLIEKIAKAGYKLDDVEQYLLNRHAQEANAQNRKLTGKDDSTAYGISDAEAQAYLDKAPKELAKLADEVQALTDKAQQLRLDNGIETQERIDAMNGAYKYYVPVRGDAESQQKKTQFKGTGKGFSLKYKPKRRLGHELRNESVIENIFQDYERAIIQVEKNRIGKSLALMAAEIQMPELVSIEQPVKRKVLQTQKAYGVLVKGDLVDVFQTQEAANQNKQLLVATDKKLTLSDITIAPITDQRLIYSASPMLADNEVVVYMNGHEVRLQINDELMARAYKNMGTEALGSILSAGRAINGWMSKVYTGYNPEFILTNIQRDFQSGFVNLTGEQGILIAGKAVANYPKSFASLLKYAATGESDKWIDSYRENGGNTGAAYLPDLERLGQEVRKEYASYQGVIANLKEGDSANALRAAGRKTFNATLKYIEHLNAAGENAFRLATFKAMVESGKSVAESANMAKNVTVNFNRKGELGAELNALYLFFNASVQGTAATSHALFKGRHKYQAWGLVGAMMSIGYMSAAMLGGFDDEDEYDKVSDATKSRNLIMSYGDGYVKIPVPYGYGFFYNAGRMYADAQRKGEVGKMPYQLMALATEEFSPFNVASTEDSEFSSRKVFFGILPTTIRIPAEITNNFSSFTGRELYPEKEWYKSEPDNERMWSGTKGTVYDISAQYLASIGVEISPETLKFMTRTATGGSGAFVDTSVSAAMLKKENAELETREIPFVRKFYGENSIQDSRARYGKAKDEARIAYEKFNALRQKGDIASVREFVNDKKELIALNNAANKMSDVIKIIRDQQDEIKLSDRYTTAEKRLKIKELEKQEEKYYDMFMKKYKQVKEK